VVEKFGESWTDVGSIVTNGPFVLDYWKRAESLVLRRNEDYRGRFAGNLKRVEIQFSGYGDVSRADSYNADETDAFLVAPNVVNLASLRSRFSSEFVPGIFDGTTSLAFDMSRPPFNDSRVRRALGMATDKIRVVKEVTPWANRYSLPATGGLVPPGIPGHSPGISLRFNPQEAKNLLADAGYPKGNKFPLIEVVNFSISEGLDRRWERSLSSQWGEILGIESKFEFLDWESFLKRTRTNPPMMFFSPWSADYPDPNDFLTVGITKLTGWQSAVFEEFLERSKKCMDQNERLTLLMEADKILMEEAPIIPLLYYGLHYLVKPWIRRFFPAWKDVIIDPH